MMKNLSIRNIFLATIFITINFLSFAQSKEPSWEFGLNLNGGLLIFEMTDESMYDINQFTGRNGWIAGGGLSIKRNVNESFYILTGVDYNTFHYRMKHGNLGFSNQLKGQVDHFFDFNKVTLPLFFVPSLEVEEGWMVDLLIGPSFHFNFLSNTGFVENDLSPRDGNQSISVTANYDTKSSSQFLASMNFGFSVYPTDKAKQIKFILLYERGIFNNRRIDMTTTVGYNGETNTFSAALEPVLSSLKLGIYYFPDFINKR